MLSTEKDSTYRNYCWWNEYNFPITAGEMQKNPGELSCHLVDVLELILPNSYNGPQWGNFALSRNWKNKKHRILDISLKDIHAGFGCSRSKNKNFKTRENLCKTCSKQYSGATMR